MISFFRSTRQIRRLIFLPRSILNKYYFSGTAPFDCGVPPSSSTPTNQNLDISKSQKQQSGSTVQLKGQSSDRKNISEVAQKAIWASAIINHVLSSSPPKSIQKSLRDEILELRIPVAQKKFNLEDKYRDQIMAYFDKGVEISKIVYNQERVLKAHFKSATRFFPTNSVSKIMFEKMKYVEPNILIGSFGIGKTFSIIGFIELVKHINRLKYLSYGKWVDKSTAEYHRSQLEMLKKQNLIGDFPKYWYWSIRVTLQQTEKHAMELILLQMDQLGLPDYVKKQLDQCNGLEDLIFKIKKYHPTEKQLPMMIVIDQINAVTSGMRNWNTQVTRLKRDKKPLSQASQNIVRDYKIPAQRIIPVIRQFRKLGITYILNSSFNLQKELIGRISDLDQLSLRFIDHGEIKPITIQYARQLVKQEVRMEFLQFFLFILQQKCMQNPNPEILNKFSLIKKNLNSDLINVKNYYRPLFVVTFFKDEFKFQDSQALNEENIKDFLVELSKKFDEYCLKQSQARLIKFLNQGDDAAKKYKYMVIKAMQDQARQCLNKGIQKLRFSASRLQKIAKQYTFAQNLAKVKTYLATLEHNNQLLPCTYIEQDKSVEFDWSPRDFLEIANTILYPQIIDPNKFLFQRPIQDIVRDKDKKTIGTITQYFIKILFSQRPRIEVNALTMYNDKPYKQNLTFTIYGIQTFLIFNEQSLTNKKITQKFEINEQNKKVKKKEVRLIGSLQRNLRKLLTISKQDPKNYYFGIPVSKKSQNDIEKNSLESQGIDMILIKYIPKQQLFEITTIDATVGQKNISKKVKNAQNLLKKMLKKVPKYADRPQLQDTQSNIKDTETTQYIQDPGPDTNNYIINHVIICPAKSCGEPKIVSKDLLTISYFPLEDIRFPGNEDNEIIKYYQKWKKVTIQESQK